MKGGNSIFSDIVESSSTGIKTRGKQKSRYLKERDNHLEEISAGNLKNKVERLVRPEECRMWDQHNRDYEKLSQKNCQDLIDGIKAQGRQEFPAIVRKLPEGNSHTYEVICGARRHFAISWLNQNNYPDFKYLVEVRDINDEEAFRLSDIENRDKLDISDYERAVDYKQALGLYYDTQGAMAERLEVSKNWLSKYLDLAELPKEVVGCFADLHDLKASYTRSLKPLLKTKTGKAGVLGNAKATRKEQKKLNDEGRAALNGKQVIARLTKDPKKKAMKIEAQTFNSKNGSVMMTVKDATNQIEVRIPKNGDFSTAELVRCFQAQIKEIL